MSVYSAAGKPQVLLSESRQDHWVFSVLLLHTALRAWNLGRLLLRWAKETAEMVGAGAVRLTPWCGAGVLPTGLFFHGGR